MAHKIKVVIGAGFGDKGKGLMTDYFCSSFPKDEPVLNVRFNGGAQAGHTVVTPYGLRHVFGHFGAGSFLPNVATYLSSEFLVNPILFRREYEKLLEQGLRPMVFMHPKCLLTIPQDMMINQMVERFRGAARHGSCGVGIFETIYRSKFEFGITLDKALDGRTISRLTDRDYSSWHLEELGVVKVSEEDKALLSNQNISAHYCDDVRFMRNHVIIADESVLNKFRNIVFEGAQGLMLDQNNLDYFPHLTPSNTGIQNVVECLSKAGISEEDLEVCYVTRTYLTRHGAGRFNTECPREFMHGVRVDKTNHHNEFQGGFRYGLFDQSMFVEHVLRDVDRLGARNAKLTIAFTHADETEDMVYTANGRRIPVKEFKMPKVDVNYISRGEKRINIEKMR